MDQAKNNIEQFVLSLGITPKNMDYFTEAFTHRSFINERRKEKAGLSHNERLEFLGDAVLELIASEYLFAKYPNRPEGELTSFRAATVKTESLAYTARSLEYGQHLLMSHGEEATGGREKDYLLANTYEAVLGAIYLDQGYEACKEFVYRTLIPKVETIVEQRLDIDAKTKFQELAQEIFKLTPNYDLVSESGPDHDKIFEMAVKVGDKTYGIGKGSTKQKAEESAAQKALEEIAENKEKA